MYRYLFSPITINRLEIKNRIAYPSLGLLFSYDSKLNERYYGFFRERARGGAGIVTVGPVGVDFLGAGIMALSLYRAVFGPTVLDRLIGVNAIGSKTTVLLLIIVAVAAFNIVTSLTMVVNEKEKDIAVLRTLGVEPGRIMRIFVFQGSLIGLAGALAGVGIGLALAFNLETILPWAERTFGFSVMPGGVFYVTRVPSSVELAASPAPISRAPATKKK
mgnify:CR=1 FL=1